MASYQDVCERWLARALASKLPLEYGRPRKPKAGKKRKWFRRGEKPQSWPRTVEEHKEFLATADERLAAVNPNFRKCCDEFLASRTAITDRQGPAEYVAAEWDALALAERLTVLEQARTSRRAYVAKQNRA